MAFFERFLNGSTRRSPNMREWRAEFLKQYETYSFGYCSYALYESGDVKADIYAGGYLPFSGSPDAQSVFYMARSARVPLTDFALTSENRRIAKMFDARFTRSSQSPAAFAANEENISFCLNYFASAHDARIMPRERLLHVLSDPLTTDVVSYWDGTKPIAHIIMVRDSSMDHFWFSSFSTEYLKKNLGMWLMLDCVREAKNEGKKYFYLGTVYGAKALYKANLEPLEWWNGTEWKQDAHNRELRTRANSDENAASLDVWQATLRRF